LDGPHSAHARAQGKRHLELVGRDGTLQIELLLLAREGIIAQEETSLRLSNALTPAASQAVAAAIQSSVELSRQHASDAPWFGDLLLGAVRFSPKYFSLRYRNQIRRACGTLSRCSVVSRS
jgi:hypothetical protein